MKMKLFVPMLLGAVGVSGAPGGEKDEACAIAASRPCRSGLISRNRVQGPLGFLSRAS